jgi:hypothetical protein
MLKQDEIDKLFADQLKDHQVVPPSRVWDNIEAELDQKSKKRLFIVLPQWMMAAGILLIIGLGVTLYWLLPHQAQVSIEIAQQTEVLNSHSEKIQDTNTSITTQANDIQKYTKNTNNYTITTFHDKTISTNASPSRQLLAVGEVNASEEMQPLEPRSYAKQKSYNINTKYPKRKYLPFPPAHFDENQFLSQTPSKSSDDKWQVGAMVSPTYSYRTTNKEVAVNTSGINSLNGGLTVNMKKTKRLNFETGIVYAKVGQEATISNISSSNRPLSVSKNYAVATQIEELATENGLGVVKLTGSDNNEFSQMYSNSFNSADNSFTPATTSSTVTPELQMTLEYIEIPFSARYFLTSQKLFRLSLSTGLSANFLVGNTTSTNISNQTGEVSGIESVSYSTRLGFGIDVPLSRNFIINLEPMFKYFITPVNNATSVEYRPYSMGFNTGISYRF